MITRTCYKFVFQERFGRLLISLTQCAIPVFDGLLPEPHNTRVLKLLFDLAHWHGLAKLHMHTDTTLDVLSQATVSLGNTLREFEDKTCSLFQTRELAREQAARQRRQAKQPASLGAAPAPNNNTRRPKHLNLKTYKNHALGDYGFTIRRLGTTDSYSTQPVSLRREFYLKLVPHIHSIQVELEHRTSKGRLIRTNGRMIPLQLSRIERRQYLTRTIREKTQPLVAQMDGEVNIPNDPKMRYNMGKAQNSPVHLPTFLKKNSGDPAIKVSGLRMPLVHMLTPLPLP